MWVFSQDYVNAREQGLFYELDQAFKHLGLAGEVPVQGRFRDAYMIGQSLREDAFAAVGVELRNRQSALRD